MMSRRTAMVIVGKAMTAGAGWLIADPAQSSFFSRMISITPAAQAQTFSTYEARLQSDMALLSKRVYSEEGIPMILACEDLTAKQPVVPASHAMNDAVAPAFQRVVDAWQHLHPDALVGDVAKLLELLAYRDFAGGGKDNNL